MPGGLTGIDDGLQGGVDRGVAKDKAVVLQALRQGSLAAQQDLAELAQHKAHQGGGRREKRRPPQAASKRAGQLAVGDGLRCAEIKRAPGLGVADQKIDGRDQIVQVNPGEPLTAAAQRAAETASAPIGKDRRRGTILLERLREEGELPQSYDYPVQVVQLGDQVTLVALAGEVVVDYVLRLRKEFDSERWGNDHFDWQDYQPDWLKELEAQIAERDRLDASRAVAPSPRM